MSEACDRSGPVELDERGVARVTLNRPEVYNAYNGDMIAALLKTYDALAGKSLRAVVISGKGKNFQAGADINWLDAVRRSSPAENLKASRMTAQAVQRLNRYAGADGVRWCKAPASAAAPASCRPATS